MTGGGFGEERRGALSLDVPRPVSRVNSRQQRNTLSTTSHLHNSTQPTISLTFSSNPSSQITYYHPQLLTARLQYQILSCLFRSLVSLASCKIPPILPSHHIQQLEASTSSLASTAAWKYISALPALIWNKSRQHSSFTSKEALPFTPSHSGPTSRHHATFHGTHSSVFIHGSQSHLFHSIAIGPRSHLACDPIDLS
ncbi:hypothetical protein BT63DRAFT_449612 [Microthyrium microscopicum]|uniref:Uncharacterized protein n=1 Tax=Microthyrium microscopicum TaxID=703497 RepID=A0A6A6UT15_9PEZI|nr:hypothetical protein BT63DRAFT_449612 [Microthyrium microscopicum]